VPNENCEPTRLYAPTILRDDQGNVIPALPGWTRVGKWLVFTGCTAAGAGAGAAAVAQRGTSGVLWPYGWAYGAAAQSVATVVPVDEPWSLALLGFGFGLLLLLRWAA
jgi:hypothetical protein